MVEDGTTMVVPFSHASSYTDPLSLPSRVFTVNGTTVRITQSMQRDGKGGTALGFGAAVYPSAIVLAHFLDVHYPRRLLVGKTVLELGCGVGFCAIAAALCGAGKVIATDGDPRSVQLTRDNIANNTDVLLQATAAGAAEVTSVKLRWADLADTARVAGKIDTSTGGGGVDLIIGSDIAACPYVEALPLLLECLLTFCGKQTTVLLTHKDRNVVEESFWSLAKEHFVVTSLPRSMLHPDFAEDEGLHITRLRRKRVKLAATATED
jgi:predicted nicotinamide N-methyase